MERRVIYPPDFLSRSRVIEDAPGHSFCLPIMPGITKESKLGRKPVAPDQGRIVIGVDEAGYGPRFFHRTGHGIGLEGHEDPYLVAGNAEPLDVGMAFSVEPGIYLEGRYGARIEDIVVCGEDGPDVLNLTTRDLLLVPG